jgi:hypothetical protein
MAKMKLSIRSEHEAIRKHVPYVAWHAEIAN